MTFSIDNKAFHKISYGLYIISSQHNGRFNGQIANTVFQVTSEPPTVAVSINKQNLTHEFITKSKTFSISVLSEDTPMDLIGRFGFKSGRETDKFSGISYRLGVLGAPVVLESTLSCFEVSLENQLDAGTHTIFIGRVLGSCVLNDGESMTYSYYQKVKRGLSPKAAPTYIESSQSSASDIKVGTIKYKCSICGYIYDHESGDPENSIITGTQFVDLPDDWKCPICSAQKNKFLEIK